MILEAAGVPCSVHWCPLFGRLAPRFGPLAPPVWRIGASVRSVGAHFSADWHPLFGRLAPLFGFHIFFIGAPCKLFWILPDEIYRRVKMSRRLIKLNKLKTLPTLLPLYYTEKISLTQIAIMSYLLSMFNLLNKTSCRVSI